MAAAANLMCCCFNIPNLKIRYRRYRSKRAASSSQPESSGKHATTTTTFSELKKKNEERVKRLSREGMIDIPKDKAKVVADAGIKISPAPSYTEVWRAVGRRETVL